MILTWFSMKKLGKAGKNPVTTTTTTTTTTATTTTATTTTTTTSLQLLPIAYVKRGHQFEHTGLNIEHNASMRAHSMSCFQK